MGAARKIEAAATQLVGFSAALGWMHLLTNELRRAMAAIGSM
jgi:hypothetical protein